MAIFSRSTIKTWFETGDFPTNTQFANFIDSVFNLNDDSIEINDIEGLSSLLTSKANKDASGMSPEQVTAWQSILEIGDAGVQSDWAEVDIENLAYINNKPEVVEATGATAFNDADSILIKQGSVPKLISGTLFKNWLNTVIAALTGATYTSETGSGYVLEKWVKKTGEFEILITYTFSQNDIILVTLFDIQTSLVKFDGFDDVYAQATSNASGWAGSFVLSKFRDDDDTDFTVNALGTSLGENVSYKISRVQDTVEYQSSSSSFIKLAASALTWIYTAPTSMTGTVKREFLITGKIFNY